MGIDREHQDQRRKILLELLAAQPMKRQIDVGRALRKQGFKVTQSTVSRDLTALGIVRKGGFYRPPSPRGDETAIGKMEEFIRRVRRAGPYMLVLETNAGAAKAVALALKKADWPEMKGVVAEDETLFVATDNVYDTRLLLTRLRRIIRPA